MTLLTVVLIVNAPVFAGLVGAHMAGRDRGFDAIAGLLLIGEVLLALAMFVGIPVVGWIGFGISMFVWALFLLKYHRPILRFFSGGRLAAEKRFSAVDVLESRYHLKLDGPLRSFLAGQLWRKHDGRLVASLPSYISEPHTNLRIRFGEIAVAEAAADWDVDWQLHDGWLPLASLVASSGDLEQQFLVIHAVAPHRLAMWEHETGELVPVVDSLDEFVASLI